MDESLSFKLSVFEGPLDLLLHLIQKNKLSIYDIPIAEISDQYMEYVQTMTDMNLDVTGDFLVMAAQLLYIKSKMLLPKAEGEEEEEDPRSTLVESLLEYKRYKDTLPFFEEHQKLGQRSYIKPPDALLKQFGGFEPVHASLKELLEAYQTVMKKIERKAPPPKSSFHEIISHKIYSVTEKEEYLKKLLQTDGVVVFDNLFSEVSSRSEAVALFLAILELIKVNVIGIVTLHRKLCLILTETGDNSGNKGN